MKSRFLAIALALTLFSMPSVVQAADAVGPKIAVVDLQRLLSESKAGQDIQSQLNTRREAFQKEVADQEKKLRDSEAALEKLQQDKKSPEEFGKKKVAFEKSLVDTRQNIQKKRVALEKAASDGITDLRNSAAAAIGDIAEKNKIDLVLLRQGVIIANKDMDITDEAMAVLNSKVSKVPLKFEAQ